MKDSDVHEYSISVQEFIDLAFGKKDKEEEYDTASVVRLVALVIVVALAFIVVCM